MKLYQVTFLNDVHTTYETAAVALVIARDTLHAGGIIEASDHRVTVLDVILASSDGIYRLA